MLMSLAEGVLAFTLGRALGALGRSRERILRPIRSSICKELTAESGWPSTRLGGGVWWDPPPSCPPAAARLLELISAFSCQAVRCERSHAAPGLLPLLMQE